MHWSYRVPSAGKITLITTYKCSSKYFAIRMGVTYTRSRRTLATFSKECADTRDLVYECKVKRTFNDPAGSQRWQVGVYRQVWRTPTSNSEVNSHWVINFTQ